jgi:hypothetical protein
VTDVATPLTFERYTGDGKGMFMRWMRSSGFQRKHGYVRKTVLRLDNLSITSNETTDATTKERRVTNQATSTDGLCSSPDVPRVMPGPHHKRHACVCPQRKPGPPLFGFSLPKYSDLLFDSRKRFRQLIGLALQREQLGFLVC